MASTRGCDRLPRASQQGKRSAPACVSTREEIGSRVRLNMGRDRLRVRLNKCRDVEEEWLLRDWTKSMSVERLTL